ncbi:MAG: hypothetical protein NVSMB14_17200 [Isosphaeraceae bacterium]
MLDGFLLAEFTTAQFIDQVVGNIIYVALALLATWGAYNGLLTYRNMTKKSIKGPQALALLQRVRDAIVPRPGKPANYEEAIKICQEPAYWHSALAQLVSVALKNREKGILKVKQLLVMEFHTEVISRMENRLASIGTIVRMGPLLGLLGTVASMIGAFGRLGGSQKVNPNALAKDISLALWATGAGLLIATPMMIVGNDMHAKLRHLRDVTERQLGDFLEIMEHVENPAGRAPGASRSGTVRAVLPR